MKAEKVILSFIAIFIGLVAAGVAFYLYQMTKTVPPQKAQTLSLDTKSLSPTPDASHLLVVESPKDEEVLDKKVISVNGKTRSDATVIVSTETTDEVVKPAANGSFSVTQTIPNGTSILHVTAIFPNGEERRVTRTVTFSTENF